MEGTDAINSQNAETDVAIVSTSSVTEDSTNGTQRISLDKDIRGNPAYCLAPKDKVLVKLMKDGEIRIRKLADV